MNFWNCFQTVCAKFRDCFRTVRVKISGLFLDNPDRIFGTDFRQSGTWFGFGFDIRLMSLGLWCVLVSQ